MKLRNNASFHVESERFYDKYIIQIAGGFIERKMATDSTTAKIQATIERLSKRLKAGPLNSHASEDQAKVRDDVLQLKKHSRSIHEEAYLAKENVATLRKATDAAHLALQSVHYEKKHLEKELSQILATDAYDSIEFSVPEAPSTAEPMAAMNNKLMRVKNEVTLRQSEFYSNSTKHKQKHLTYLEHIQS